MLPEGNSLLLVVKVYRSKSVGMFFSEVFSKYIYIGRTSLEVYIVYI